VVPYVAAGGVAVAVGLAIWKRKAIASWFRR
jgi:putative N-acetylmannosamine-6-phosphate epimerase